MKDRTKKGMSKVNHCTPLTNKMEDNMWKAGVLGNETLVERVLFLIGINDKHKRLHQPGCNSQISVKTDSEGRQCLVFHDDPYSKPIREVLQHR